MIDSLPIWIGLLIVVLVSVSGLMFVAGYYWHQVRGDKNGSTSKSFNHQYVEQQIATFDQSLEGIEASLDSLSHAMGHISKRQYASNDSGPVVREQAYRIAQRMAATGASRMELIRTCGITPGEATLIRRLQPEAASKTTASS